MAIDTLERRKKIVQLVRNEFPDCEAVFSTEDADALSFRIRSRTGNFRTGTIKLLGHHSHIILNKAWLLREVDQHGGPHSP